MKANDLTAFLSSNTDKLETLNWLKGPFKDAILTLLNDIDVRKRIGLYGGDKIPENERNLTDSRNRVSLIIEYEFARALNKLLSIHNVDNQFCAYVVANRFPDLELRSNDGTLGLRFEVKCLQSTAEEKSGNFSTLKKDIKPNNDYIIVFLWDWDDQSEDVVWNRAPFIFNLFVFGASELAILRDLYWLNQPPNNLGDGYQGFDIRYPVNCREGKYNQEEGNYGKILRLWQHDFSHRPESSSEIIATERDYLQFKSEVSFKGFEVLANQILPIISESNQVEPILDESLGVIGFKSMAFGFLSSNLVKRVEIAEIMQRLDMALVWCMNDKYQWSKYQLKHGNAELEARGNKPKFIMTDLFVD